MSAPFTLALRAPVEGRIAVADVTPGRPATPGESGIAAKALKKAKYHLRHSAEWVRMLGDGTVESHGRAQRALDAASDAGPGAHEAAAPATLALQQRLAQPCCQRRRPLKWQPCGTHNAGAKEG